MGNTLCDPQTIARTLAVLWMRFMYVCEVLYDTGYIPNALEKLILNYPSKTLRNIKLII